VLPLVGRNDAYNPKFVVLNRGYSRRRGRAEFFASDGAAMPGDDGVTSLSDGRGQSLHYQMAAACEAGHSGDNGIGGCLLSHPLE
jgi:hypothetical protein